MKVLRAGFAALLVAMATTVALAVPAAAVDAWEPPPPKAVTADQIKYKYGIDYWQREWTASKGSPVSTWDSLQRQISAELNPSKTNPVTRPINTSNVPLTGKIIEPGKSIVRAPSTYKPSVILPGAGALLSRGLLGAGFGMGGVSQAPGNWREIAQAQGLPTGCYVQGDTSGCSGADMKKVFDITSCNLSNSCTAIGATAPDGTGSPFADWFKDTALPFLDDLWAQLTGQKQEEAAIDQHYDVTPNGCLKSLKFEFRGPNNGTLHMTNTDVKGRPTSGAANQYAWDQTCAPSVKDNLSTAVGLTGGRFETVCQDATGKVSVDGSPNSFYGVTLGVGTAQWDTTTGQNKVGLCVGADKTLLAIRFFNNQPQTYYNSNPSVMAALTYFEWINPDPNLNTIESTKITTSWDCRAANGTVVTYSKSVTKIGAAIEPVCPLGSELIRHDIKASDGGSASSRTIDSGGEVPGSAAKYPLCLGGLSQGCTMDVYVDGQKCTAVRTECQTWPAVNGTTPSRVTCRWGTYTMPTMDCYGLSNGYKSETGSVWDPHSGTWQATDVYGNPVPGANPEPWFPTNPYPTPGVSIGTTPDTGTGTGTPTTPGPVPIPSANGGNCWPGGVAAFNPAEWVLMPVKCALQWAFVPQETVAQQNMTRIQNSIGKVGVVGAIGTVGEAVNSVGGAAGGGAGCEGPTFHFDFDIVHETIQPFNACSEPVATMAAISNAFTTVVVIVMGVFGVVRALGASVGFNFSMGKGGSE